MFFIQEGELHVVWKREWREECTKRINLISTWGCLASSEAFHLWLCSIYEAHLLNSFSHTPLTSTCLAVKPRRMASHLRVSTLGCCISSDCSHRAWQEPLFSGAGWLTRLKAQAHPLLYAGDTCTFLCPRPRGCMICFSSHYGNVFVHHCTFCISRCFFLMDWIHR